MLQRNKLLLNALIFLLIGLSIFIRWISLPLTNVDMNGYINWYNYILEHGFKAMGDDFASYTPPYLYLLWIATLTHGFLPPLTAIKLIPIVFDLLDAYIVYKIVKLKYTTGNFPLLASAIFIIMPTVIMNSSVWGQIDSAYTFFLILCVYFLLKDRPLIAMLAFSIAISFKAQAFFLFPFLIVMAFKRRIPWSGFLIPPLIYLVMILPAVILGRSFYNALTIYLSQANTFSAPSVNAPNLYSLTTVRPYLLDWINVIHGGFIVAAISIGVWIIVYATKQYEVNNGLKILSALISFALVPFVLPKMHDRYFYPADVLSVVFSFYFPGYWFIPIFYQVASGIVYYMFLVSINPVIPIQFFIAFAVAAGFTSMALVILLIKQDGETKRITEP